MLVTDSFYYYHDLWVQTNIVYLEFYILYIRDILYILYKLYILNTRIISKTVFPFSKKLAYPAIQISDPINPRREYQLY